MSARFVTIHKAEELTGYSTRAIQTKIDRGVWVQGRQWIRAPDGRILIDMEGYEEWATSDIQASRRAMEGSGSTSRAMAA